MSAPTWQLFEGDCLDRFWSKVDRAGECWTWGACVNRDGYGLVRWHGKTTKAHRVSWAIANGPIPAGALVLHRCDHPPCVNPAHLFLGTDADNAADRASKGRGAIGERHARAKLRTADVAAIRERVAAGEVQKALAGEYGVATSTINRIVSREHWARQ